MKFNKHALIIFFLLLSMPYASCQSDSLLSKLSFEMDFRFRAEQDWNSRKSDGTYRDDRSRLRYRMRAGVVFKEKDHSFGLRIRTGDQRKQQDPQLTLGKGLMEFGTLPIGFEKIYWEFSRNLFKLWLGKNTYPFDKNNELFWSDNVFPEGFSLSKSINIENGVLDKIRFTVGHFILSSRDRSFIDDSYFQGAQISVFSHKEMMQVSAAIYQLSNIPNIPDGAASFDLAYSILHLRSKCSFSNVSFDFDLYYNAKDYNSNLDIAQEFRDQKLGYTLGVQYGDLLSSQAWMYRLTYAYLERYSILDYMAQNDWARWDYSSDSSPDGRLTNFRGIEAVVAYSITERCNLVMKYYTIKQLVPFGSYKENGQRIRFDLNIKI